MKNDFFDRNALNYAEPIGPIRHDGIEVGYLYKVKVMSADGETAHAAKRTELTIYQEQQRRASYNKKKRRCVVRMKLKRNNVRVAWSCVKFNVRLGLLAPRKAFDATNELYPTLGAAMCAIQSAGLVYEQ